MSALRWLVRGLFVVHAGLVLWALVGFVELVVAEPPWPRLSNPRFPDWMLFAQWLAVLAGGLAFCLGLLTRWPGTPGAMTWLYGLMAAICLIQNASGMLVHEGHWRQLGLEYAVYAAILGLLHGSDTVRGMFAIPPRSARS